MDKFKFQLLIFVIQYDLFRKLPLIMGLVGKFIYSSMIVVNTMMPNWPVQYIIYTATIPAAFTGSGIYLNNFA